MPTTTAPAVTVIGSITAVTFPEGFTEYYNHDKLTTAYLVYVDAPLDNRGQIVRNTLAADYGFSQREALRFTLVANMLVRHNLEP